MTEHEDVTAREECNVLQQLHAADASSPPPPGQAITGERLRHRLQRRRSKALLASAALLFSGLSIWSLLTTSTGAATAITIDAQFDAGLNAIGSRIDRLLAELAEPLPAANLGSEQLRYELAQARASALVSWQDSSPIPSSETEFTQTPDPSEEIR